MPTMRSISVRPEAGRPHCRATQGVPGVRHKMGTKECALTKEGTDEEFEVRRVRPTS